MEILHKLGEALSSGLADKLVELLFIVAAFFGAILYKRYKGVFIALKIASTRITSDKRVMTFVWAIVSFIVIAVMIYLGKYHPAFIKQGAKTAKTYWAYMQTKVSVIIITVAIALMEVMNQVVKKKYPQLLLSENLKTTVDSHYEQILSNFENDTISYEDYMEYKKVNHVMNYKRENEVMYSKLVSKKITQKQFNKYIKTEQDLKSI